MKKIYSISSFRCSVLSLLLPIIMTAQQAIAVNTSVVLNDVSTKPFGLNMNTFNDDQANRPIGARALNVALTDMGAKFLRFPGGEKSDVYKWAVAPYNNPTTATLARISSSDFPASFPSIWNLSTGTWASNNYNFDEFMLDCIAVNAEPVIVVAFDGMYKPAFAGGTSLTYSDALAMAVEWVRYANVTKNYNVKYWSLGNETFNNTSYGGSNPGYTQYGIDVATFAQAMKAVDPTIKIGINASTTAEFQAALVNCAPYVDFLDVHTYPCFNFKNYSTYENQNISATDIVTSAQVAIQSLPNQMDRDRLKIAMTEISAYGYPGPSEVTNWDTGSNLGQSLANFDLMAQLAQDSRVSFSQFWNSRWINNNSPSTQSTDLFDRNNNLNASGKSIAILNNNTFDKMVATTNTNNIKSFASLDSNTKNLNVFLLNKASTATATSVTLNNYLPNSTVSKFTYQGTSVQDVAPNYAQGADISITGSQIATTLPANSITVLKFTGQTTTSNLNIGSNLDFELDQSGASVTPWIVATTGGFGGLTNANSRNGSFCGYAGGGSSSLTQTLTGLLPNTSYNVSFWVRSFIQSGAVLPTVGVRNSGATAVSQTVPDTNGLYVEVVRTFFTGATNTTADIYLQLTGATGNYGWIDDVTVVPTVPLSVNDSVLDNTISIYPNPFISEIVIESKLGIAINKAQLIGISGAVIETYNFQESETSYKLKVDTSLSKGIYFLKVSTFDGKSKVMKLVK